MKNKKLLFSMLVFVVVCLFVGVKDAKASEYEENLIKKIAPDGKNAVLKMVKPKGADNDEAYLTAAVNKLLNEEKYSASAYCPNNISECMVSISSNDTDQEGAFSKEYTINVTYDEPENNDKVNSFIGQMKDFASDNLNSYYYVTDLNLINYYLSNVKSELWESGAASRIIKYSNDIIKLSKGGNLEFYLELRSGEQDENIMFENAFGEMTVFFEDYARICKQQGIYLRRVIYIPQDTADSKEAYIAAAQKRINDYLGNDKDVKITYGGALNTLTNDALDKTVPTNQTDGNYYNVTVKGKTYKFYIMKGTSDKLVAPIYLGSDLSSNVTITSDKADIPLDTQVTAKKVVTDIIKKVLGTDKYDAYDILLYSNTKNSAITQLTSGKFKVTLPITDELKDKKLVVYYIDDKGEKKEYAATVKDNMIIFETEHFSTYAVAEKQQTTQAKPVKTTTKKPIDNNDKGTDTGASLLDKTPPTSDNSNVIIYIITLVVSISSVILIRRKLKAK